jgi:hypothetical protein
MSLHICVTDAGAARYVDDQQSPTFNDYDCQSMFEGEESLVIHLQSFDSDVMSSVA